MVHDYQQYKSVLSQMNQELLFLDLRYMLHCTLPVMGKVRNIFAVNVGRYTKTELEQRITFASAKSIWEEATQRLLAA